jgi:hypothetical protein
MESCGTCDLAHSVNLPSIEQLFSLIRIASVKYVPENRPCESHEGIVPRFTYMNPVGCPTILTFIFFPVGGLFFSTATFWGCWRTVVSW